MTDSTSIRRLNDAFRAGHGDGKLLLTRGVAGRPDTIAILQAVRTYEVFDEDDDPHQEHDFGALTLGGDKIFWKIDYYDKAMDAGSPDPADPTVTTRVLTVMLADEY